MKKLFIKASSIFLVMACAHYPDVRPGKKEHRVVVTGESEEQGFNNAMGQARDYCDDAQKKKKPVIIKEDKKYVGSMDEKTYKNAKTAAKISGGIASVVGGKREREGGKEASNIDMGKPYEVTLVFECN